MNINVYESHIPHLEKKFYYYILFPIVKLKDFFLTIYNWLINLLFSELIKGKNDYDEITNLFGFIIFGILSYLFFLIRNYDNLVILTAVFFWYLDVLWAKHIYLNTKKFDKIIISESSGNYSLYSTSFNNPESLITTFYKSELKEIVIHKDTLKSGAFFNELLDIWRLYIKINDITYMIDEKTELSILLDNAINLSNVFAIPIKFADSELFNFMSLNIFYNDQKQFKKMNSHMFNHVRFKTINDTKYIYPKTNVKNILSTIKIIFDKSFFFLFILMLQGVMERLGKFINFFISPFFGCEEYELCIDLTFAGLFGFFKPNGNIIDLIEWLSAVLIIIGVSGSYFRKKNITINNNLLSFYIGKKKIADIDLKSICAVVSIKHPAFSILIITENNTYEIKKIQNENFLNDYFYWICTTLELKRNII